MCFGGVFFFFFSPIQNLAPYHLVNLSLPHLPKAVFACHGAAGYNYCLGQPLPEVIPLPWTVCVFKSRYQTQPLGKVVCPKLQSYQFTRTNLGKDSSKTSKATLRSAAGKYETRCSCSVRSHCCLPTGYPHTHCSTGSLKQGSKKINCFD